MRGDPTTVHDQELDLLIVGGGLQGASLACEAAVRGLSTVLIDRDDFVGGSSAWGSRRMRVDLAAGPDAPLAAEALHEREQLLRQAPHLVRPLPVLLPLRDGEGAESARELRRRLDPLYRLAGGSTLPPPADAAADECARLFPGLREDGLYGGVLHFEAAVQDGRLNLALLEVATRAGAQLLSYVELIEAAGRGTVRLHDRVSGRELEVRPRRLVIAAGSHGDEVRRRLGVEGNHLLRLLRGVQLVFDPIDCETALVDSRAGVRGAGRRYLIPQQDGVLCGAPARPVAVREWSRPDDTETGELRAALAEWLPSSVLGTSCRALHRWHAVPRTGPPRLVAETCSTGAVHSLIGGTLATHRPLAARALAELTGSDPERACPADYELPGTVGPRDITDPLWWRHGNRAEQLRAAVAKPSLLQPLCPHRPFLVVEAHYALRTQGVITFADLALRRLLDARGPCHEVACRQRLHEIYVAARPDAEHEHFEEDDADLLTQL